MKRPVTEIDRMEQNALAERGRNVYLQAFDFELGFDMPPAYRGKQLGHLILQFVRRQADIAELITISPMATGVTHFDRRYFRGDSTTLAEINAHSAAIERAIARTALSNDLQLETILTHGRSTRVTYVAQPSDGSHKVLHSGTTDDAEINATESLFKRKTDRPDFDRAHKFMDAIETYTDTPHAFISSSRFRELYNPQQGMSPLDGDGMDHQFIMQFNFDTQFNGNEPREFIQAFYNHMCALFKDARLNHDSPDNSAVIKEQCQQNMNRIAAAIDRVMPYLQ